MTFKTLTIAAAATTLLASAAAANTFSYTSGFDSQSVDLGAVTANGAGVVEIYDYHAGQQGALLGVEAVNPGANYDVSVTLDQPAVNDVLAVLTVDGQVVATQELDNLE